MSGGIHGGTRSPPLACGLVFTLIADKVGAETALRPLFHQKYYCHCFCSCFCLVSSFYYIDGHKSVTKQRLDSIIINFIKVRGLGKATFWCGAPFICGKTRYLLKAGDLWYTPSRQRGI